MYRLLWDEETHGILLTDRPEGGVPGEVRPVFHEELDLLGFSEEWSYPASPAPLLWSIGRRYYYAGECVAEAKGGAFFQRPEIHFLQRDLHLEPVDVEAMVRRNGPLMEGLVYRSMEFVHRQYHRLRKRVDVAAVAFSGGKDSLVMLDLVQRALPPDAFHVVFGDTTMELRSTYEAVDRAKTHWPQLRFHTAPSPMPATESWRAFGPPSRIHRWCCSVHKSAPTLRLLRQLAGKDDLRALVFDGCRREESQRRSTYEPVTEGGKHATQVNASPILVWNAGETYLYAAERELTLNDGYRRGFVRTGCAVCPMASKWWDALAWMIAPDEVQPFLDVLFDLGRGMGISEVEVRDFVASAGWKGRAGGRGLPNGGNRVLASETGPDLTLRIRAPLEDWFEWVKPVAEVSREGDSSGHLYSRADGARHAFRVTTHDQALEIQVLGLNGADKFLKGDLKAAAQKAACCVHCGSCEAECPTGALHVDGHVRVDANRCAHCGNCLRFVTRGCWVAKSLSISEEAPTTSPNIKLRTYQHFGMRKIWLEEYFRDPEIWWRTNSLGNCQFDAMKSWLVDAEVVRKNAITGLGERLRSLGVENPLTWQVIWCNLARNSTLVRWYVTAVPWHVAHSKAELIALLPAHLSTSTRENGFTALTSLLANTPLGEPMGLGRFCPSDSHTKSLCKQPLPNADPLAVLYSLYRYAEARDSSALRMSQLLEGGWEGPVNLFGFDAVTLARSLQGLSVRYPAWLRAELQRDLDNLYLEPSHNPWEVLGLA